MISNPTERRASLTFGMPWNSGTRRPNTVNAFRRGSTLGLYPIVRDVLITGGWKLGRPNRVWTVGTNRVWKVWRKS